MFYVNVSTDITVSLERGMKGFLFFFFKKNLPFCYAIFAKSSVNVTWFFVGVSQ